MSSSRLSDAGQASPANSGLFRTTATAAALASLVAYAAVLSITPASINEIGDYYSVGPAKLGWLLFALIAGFLVSVLSTGGYADRKGKLGPITFGCLAMAFGLTLFGATHSFAMAVIATVIMGLGGGACEGCAMALVGDLFRDDRRTAMMNLTQAAFGVGAVTSPVGIAALLAAGGSWRTGYFGAAAIALASAIVAGAALLMKREEPVGGVRSKAGWQMLLSDRLVWWLSIGILLYVGAECGQANWLAKYMREDLRASGALAAASPAFFWLGITGGRVLAAWLLPSMDEIILVRGMLALAAASQFALLVASSSNVGLVATLLLGMFLGPIYPLIVSVAGRAYPESSGVITGIVVAVGALGGGIFPPGIGGLAEFTGMRLALWVCFAVLLVDLVLFLRLKSERRASAG